MPKNITQYNLLISCPGDITDEIKIIEEVVEKFNQQFTNSLGLSILSRHWSKSSYPQSGGKPQDLLNEQFVKDCDAAVAIFWTRFGTPTDEYKSGSEEEIQIMLNSGKQVFLYFCEKPVKPGYDPEQYKLVEELKEKYKNKGIYWPYDSNESFKELFYAHLTQYFLTVKKIDTINSEIKPKLALKSISGDNNIVDKLVVQRYIVPNPMPYKQRLKRIKNKIDYINTIHFYKETNDSLSVASLKWSSIASVSSMDLFKGSLIEISEDIKKIITIFADKNNLTLCNDFFNMGDLREDFAANIVSLPHGGGTVLKGTESEKQKYNYIIAVKDEIEDYILWESIEKTYSNLNIAKLLVENSGNSFDEDIDIELSVPTSFLMPHYKIPVPEFNVLDSFDKRYSFSDLFSIQQTDKYFDYDSSVKNKRYTPIPIEPVFKNEEMWFEKKYKSEINKLFSYEIFERNEETIIKLHIDYIKQHTSIAFPTLLFINTASLPNEISYKIISKNNPDIVKDTLKINDCFLSSKR